MKNIIFIAPPAAGKGTQSEILTKEFGYKHLSTGDMLREEISKQTELGLYVKEIIDKGNLVTDDIMINLIKNKLGNIEGEPFILDGFPRTLNQAIHLQELLDDNVLAIYLKLDKDEAKKRILGRLTCKCGRSYNLYDDNFKPKVPGICDSCQSELVKRADDNEESFDKRFSSFLENNAPIIEFYQNNNMLHVIDVNKDFTQVTEDIKKVIL